jgi:hypothetical protein
MQGHGGLVAIKDQGHKAIKALILEIALIAIRDQGLGRLDSLVVRLGQIASLPP